MSPYLHMYRSHSCSAKPSHFAKMQPKIHKAVVKIAYLWPVTEKKLHKIYRVFDLSQNSPIPFICNQLSLFSPVLPSSFPSFLEVDPENLLYARHQKQRTKRNSLCPKGAQIQDQSKEFIQEITLFSEIQTVERMNMVEGAAVFSIPSLFLSLLSYLLY